MMDPMFCVDDAFSLGIVVILLRECIHIVTLTVYFLKSHQCLLSWKIPIPFIMNFISDFFFLFLKFNISMSIFNFKVQGMCGIKKGSTKFK